MKITSSAPENPSPPTRWGRRVGGIFPDMGFRHCVGEWQLVPMLRLLLFRVADDSIENGDMARLSPILKQPSRPPCGPRHRVSLMTYPIRRHGRPPSGYTSSDRGVFHPRLRKSLSAAVPSCDVDRIAVRCDRSASRQSCKRPPMP